MQRCRAGALRTGEEEGKNRKGVAERSGQEEEGGSVLFVREWACRSKRIERIRFTTADDSACLVVEYYPSRNPSCGPDSLSISGVPLYCRVRGDEDMDQLTNGVLFSRVLGATGGSGPVSSSSTGPASCAVGQAYPADLCGYSQAYDNYVYQMKMESRTSPYGRPAAAPPPTAAAVAAASYPGYHHHPGTPAGTQAYGALYPPRAKQATGYDYTTR
ncbi:hypothetical protein HPB51_004024 [Rhipicephalus microplus]|uniref:Uncharacterized protein n=1 Tax=Rhipicephalus microplus TaxID=6941 RepID=A0A9J6EY86_RHIMP|nr:hypothetical protein HPB51_004024 [Rhipicephalus microplus]